MSASSTTCGTSSYLRCSVLKCGRLFLFFLLHMHFPIKLTGCFKFNAFETHQQIFFYNIIGSFSTTWISTEHTTPTYIFTKPLTFCHILSSSSESSCSWTLPRLCYSSFIVNFSIFLSVRMCVGCILLIGFTGTVSEHLASLIIYFFVRHHPFLFLSCHFSYSRH